MNSSATLRNLNFAGLALAFVLVTSSALAANITPHKNWILIEGEIVNGDYEKFQSVISESPRLHQVVLASPGGDVAEALQIGRKVRELSFSTIVPAGISAEVDRLMAGGWGIQNIDSNNVCASACFFIHAAGVFRTGAILGIHRPFMDSESLKAMLGTDAMEESRNVKFIVDDYLRDMGVPFRYLEIMFGTHKDEIYWISNDEISKDFTGPIPEITDWIESKCGKNPMRTVTSRTGQAERSRAIAEYRTYSDCEADASARLHMEAWVHARLETIESKASTR